MNEPVTWSPTPSIDEAVTVLSITYETVYDLSVCTSGAEKVTVVPWKAIVPAPKRVRIP